MQWSQRLATLLSEALGLEHAAFYFYLSAGAHCDSPLVALPHLKRFFYNESNDELLHAKKVIKFMNRLALPVTFTEIAAVEISTLSITEIFEIAEKTEQKVLQHYLAIKKEAEAEGDYVTGEFIDYFLAKQVREVKQFHDRAVNARRCKEPLGEFIFDQSFKDK